MHVEFRSKLNVKSTHQYAISLRKLKNVLLGYNLYVELCGLKIIK